MNLIYRFEQVGDILKLLKLKYVHGLLFAGNEVFDRIMTMILGMPNLAGSILACFLDNTVPGKYFYVRLITIK